MTIRRNHSRAVHNMPNAEQNPRNPMQAGELVRVTTDSVVPFVQRLTCTVDEACTATGLGRTKLYELIGTGTLATTTVGRRRLVSVHSLQTLLEPKKM